MTCWRAHARILRYPLLAAGIAAVALDRSRQKYGSLHADRCHDPLMSRGERAAGIAGDPPNFGVRVFRRGRSQCLAAGFFVGTAKQIPRGLLAYAGSGWLSRRASSASKALGSPPTRSTLAGSPGHINCVTVRL